MKSYLRVEERLERIDVARESYVEGPRVGYGLKEGLAIRPLGN